MSGRMGVPRRCRSRPGLELDDAAAALAAAERREGITQTLCCMAAPMLADARLVILLDRFTPKAVPIQFVYPQARLLAPKIRVFIDFSAPRLAARLEPSRPRGMPRPRRGRRGGSASRTEHIR